MIDHIPTIADAEHEYFEEEALPEASNLAATILWGLAAFALVLVPWATVPGKRDLGWFQEPWSWPFIVLCVALIGGAVQPIRLYALSKLLGFRAAALTAFEGMGRSLVYAGSFLCFLVAISLIGFTLSAFLYMQLLYWISGLRGGRWPWVALAVTAAIFLAFRVGLGIWFPQPPIVNFLPAWVSANLGAYL
jgi:hypothetical protein